MVRAVAEFDPDLVICPFLRERVPAEVWTNRRTIIIHPGPKGDRGPSSLDWAITDGAPEWGVTALQAVEEMDAGPIWGTRTFPIDAGAASQEPPLQPGGDRRRDRAGPGGGPQGRRPGAFVPELTARAPTSMVGPDR